MKLEIGESLFYSWLRHVKLCQVVQTNWKPSPEWELRHDESLERLMRAVEESFKSDFSVFKQTKSLAQLIRQAEVDMLKLEISTTIVPNARHVLGKDYVSAILDRWLPTTHEY